MIIVDTVSILGKREKQKKIIVETNNKTLPITIHSFPANWLANFQDASLFIDLEVRYPIIKLRGIEHRNIKRPANIMIIGIKKTIYFIKTSLT